MGQIEDLRLFVTVIDSGGIARAADVLGIAKSAVSRRLSQLEARYEVRLIDRQPRRWDITSAGQELYQRASQMVMDADDLDSDFMHAAHSLKGPLSITIAREFGLSFLRPTLFDFMETHPEINLTIDFDDRIIDLESENYDLAVRIISGDVPEMITHQIGVIRQGLYASVSYARQYGLPKNLHELATRPLLNYGAERRAKWEFMQDGKKHSIEFQPTLKSNNGPFLLDATLKNFGISRLPNFLIEKSVKENALIPVLPDFQIMNSGLHVGYSANRRLNKRMRALMTRLEQSCEKLEPENNINFV